MIFLPLQNPEENFFKHWGNKDRHAFYHAYPLPGFLIMARSLHDEFSQFSRVVIEQFGFTLSVATLRAWLGFFMHIDPGTE